MLPGSSWTELRDEDLAFCVANIRAHLPRRSDPPHKPTAAHKRSDAQGVTFYHLRWADLETLPPGTIVREWVVIDDPGHGIRVTFGRARCRSDGFLDTLPPWHANDDGGWL